ncbi:TPM domain-containing protein [Enterococcus sp. LJL51]|uniref:TPM domain-containing protein n=1 Tax=Enterococcus sp. LJL51 TaxID=3416656 RepID=UPI003CF04409
MKKIIIFLSLFVFLSFLIMATSNRSSSSPLNDYAGQFTSDQKEILEEKLRSFKYKTDIPIKLITTSENDGKSTEELLNDNYDAFLSNKRFKGNGILILFDRDAQIHMIKAEGIIESIVTEEEILASNNYAFNAGLLFSGSVGTIEFLTKKATAYFEANPQLRPSPGLQDTDYLWALVLTVIVAGWGMGGSSLYSPAYQKNNTVSNDFGTYTLINKQEISD